MRCAVIGGTGYVGVRLVRRLLDEGHEVAVLVRSRAKLAATGWDEQVHAVDGDTADPEAVAALVAGADAVVHLAHALDRPDFPERDRAAAWAVSTAAADAGVRRLVYLGGLRPASPAGGASRHLSSRAEVADVFLAGAVPTVALEASIVVGSGSTSFEMIRYLAERVPVLPAVPWLAHRTQPIAIADVLHYLVGALALPADVNRRFDIGGPDVLTYLELIRRYLRLAGLPQGVVVPVPVPVPPGGPALAGRVVEALTPLSRQLATPLIESLADDLVCGEDDVLTVVGAPPGGRTTYDAAVRAALGRRDEPPPPDGDPALAGPTDPAGSGGTVYAWSTVEPSPADVTELWSVVDGIGGDAGWFVPLRAWTVWGWADQLLGGVGGYRGRPARRALAVGDVVDGWCVEAVEPGVRLRLRSEMRAPGVLTLELAVDPDVSGHGSHLRLAVRFVPTGLAGLVYGRALLAGAPAVFGAMARGIAARAAVVPLAPPRA